MEWTNPDKSIDGTPLAGIAEVEIWLAEEDQARRPGAAGLTSKEFEAKAALGGVPEARSGLSPWRRLADRYPDSRRKKPASLKLHRRPRPRRPVQDVRVLGPRRLRAADGPGPPSELSARVLEDRIELSWKAPAANIDGSTPVAVKAYNIYTEGRGRQGQGRQREPGRRDEIRGSGRRLRRPRQLPRPGSATDKPPYFESDDSEALEVVPKDIFPPAAPARVVAVTGHGSVSLSWDANGEKDLAGYQVWRREDAEGEDVLLTPALLLENAYTDATVEKGKRYRYSMTAVDVRGNESARTETVVTAPRDGPA